MKSIEYLWKNRRRTRTTEVLGKKGGRSTARTSTMSWTN